LTAGPEPSAFPPVLRADWLRAPAGLALLSEGSVTTTPGFSAAGVAAGLKLSGAHDLGLLVADEPSVSALVDTRNALPSAAVVRNREQPRSAFRAVVVNAGSANAATGSPGVNDAERMATLAGDAVGLPAGEVAVCSTGTIGDRLDMRRIADGIEAASRARSTQGGPSFGSAICTTDAAPKAGAFRLALGGRDVIIGAAAKGAGMIRPDMATMLAYITTDAGIASAELQRLTAAAAAESFNRISVDGQMSPSDTVLVLANGAAGRLDEAQGQVFAAGLAAVMRWLAIQIVRDGEGARHVVRLTVRGARDGAEAERVARHVADSPLVKTAVAGGDPNWGRVAQAVGQALAGAPGTAVEPEIAVDGLPADRAAEAMAGGEFDLTVALERGEAEAEVWFSDLTHDYVSLNADYRT